MGRKKAQAPDIRKEMLNDSISNGISIECEKMKSIKRLNEKSKHKREREKGRKGEKEKGSWNPSKVLVPRPSSSKITNERGVASLKILEVSASSTMKVDCPPMMLSFAPILVKIRSAGVRLSDSAGTKHPIWAIIIERQTWMCFEDEHFFFFLLSSSVKPALTALIFLPCWGLWEE